MRKIIAILLTLAAAGRAAISALTIPHEIDSEAIPKVVYIDQNNDSIKAKVNEIKDTVNAYLGGGLSSSSLSSQTSVRATIDNDNNATGEAFYITRNGTTDTIFKVPENWANAARLWMHLTVDSSLTVGGKVYLADSLKLTLLTASSPVLALDATKHVIPGTTTGSGSTVVLSSGPTIVNPTWSGTIATGLTASRTLTTDASGNMAVNTETGTGSHVRATSPTTSNLTNTGTLTATAGTFSSTVTLTNTSANQLVLGGGTTVNTRIRMNRGSDDATQYSQLGFDRLEMVRSGTPLASPQTAFSFNQVGSDGSRTPLQINSDGSLTVGGPVSMSSTLGVTGKLTGSDTVAAGHGFRDGTGATATNLYRSGADMWTTPDSLTVSGRLAVGDSISTGGNEKFAYDEGSFTMTLRGCSSDPNGTAKYIRIGKLVTLTVPYLTCTSDSSGAAMTGLPSAIQPPNDQYIGRPFRENNTVVTESANNSAFIVSGSAVRFYLAGSYTTFFVASSTRSNMPNSTPGTNFIIDYTLQ